MTRRAGGQCSATSRRTSSPTSGSRPPTPRRRSCGASPSGSSPRRPGSARSRTRRRASSRAADKAPRLHASRLVSAFIPRWGVNGEGHKVDIVEKVLVDLDQALRGAAGRLHAHHQARPAPRRRRAHVHHRVHRREAARGQGGGGACRARAQRPPSAEPSDPRRDDGRASSSARVLPRSRRMAAATCCSGRGRCPRWVKASAPASPAGGAARSTNIASSAATPIAHALA